MSYRKHTITSILALSTLLARTSDGAEPMPALKEVFEGSFRVGAAISHKDLMPEDQQVLGLIAKQFNTITSENVLKWEKVHPEPERYDFERADKYVEFGERHGMFIVGHTLIWHNQTPDWVFEDSAGKPLGREALLERMRDHIHTVVGRYRGRIQAWDVVNEAVTDEGSLRNTPWRRIIGDDYLKYAFQFAQEADPTAELFYNDYSMHLVARRVRVVRLIKDLQKSGCKVDGIGMQGHWGLDYPSRPLIEDSIRAFADCTGKVAITELDINVLPRPKNLQGADVSIHLEGSPQLDPYQEGLPDAVQNELAKRYATFFRIFLRHRGVIDRVTFWGVDDGRSWHNNWPIKDRTAHSLLFDRSLSPKPAFISVIETAKGFDK